MTNTQSPAPGVAAEVEPMIRVVEKATCYAVHRGNEVIGSFAGPDCGEHAQLFATALQASAAAVPVGTLEVISGAAIYSLSEAARKLPDGEYSLYTAPPLPAQVQAAGQDLWTDIGSPAYLRDRERLFAAHGMSDATPPNAPQDGLVGDAGRLDWLERNLFERKWSGTIGRAPEYFIRGDYRHTTQNMHGETLRAGIDAAIRAGKKG